MAKFNLIMTFLGVLLIIFSDKDEGQLGGVIFGLMIVWSSFVIVLCESHRRYKNWLRRISDGS